jgi:hypothetical protein
MSNADIGEIMGRSEGAVKSLYHRTLLSLRDDLMEANRRKKSDSRQNVAEDSSVLRLLRRHRNS